MKEVDGQINSIQPSNDKLTINSIDEFKSIYCFLNAKPDSQIRLLKGVKRVGLVDIKDLCDSVNSKLDTHNVVTVIPEIQITFEDRNIQEFSSWLEFERTNWNLITRPIAGCTIFWKILVAINENQIPQPHSLKVRIGNDMPPKDAIQLLFSAEDPEELMQMSAPSICKVDFVNSHLAEELLTKVEKWHEGLVSMPRQASYLLIRYGMYFTEIFKFFSPILCLGIATRYADLVINSNWFLGLSFELKTLYSALIIVAVYQVGNYIGFRGEKLLDARIQKLKQLPVFEITKGDHRKIGEAKLRNNKFIRELLIQVSIGIIGFVGATVLPYIIKLFLRIS